MRIHISNVSSEQLQQLKKMGFADKFLLQNELYLSVSQQQFDQLLTYNFQPKIVISNLKKYEQNLKKTRKLRGYRDFNEGLELMKNLCAQFPEIIQTVEYGKSVAGKPMVAVKISDFVNKDEAEPEISFDSGIHGNEPISSELLLQFIEKLCNEYGTDSQITELINTREIWFFPFANPDGALALKRNNYNNVDLNRDWGFMWEGWGNSNLPFSQPETRALHSWINDHQFVISQSVHAGMELFSFAWSAHPSIPNDLQHMMDLATAYLKKADISNFKFGSGYHQLYPAKGAAKDSYYGSRGSLGWTIEVNKDKSPKIEIVENIFQKHFLGMLAMIKNAGNGLSGFVRDAETGEAVEATIWISQNKTTFWPTYADPKSGDFFRYLSSGIYDLKITANGYETDKIGNIELYKSFKSLDTLFLTPNFKTFAQQVIACKAVKKNTQNDSKTWKTLAEPDMQQFSLGNSGWIILDIGKSIDVLKDDNTIAVYENDANPEKFKLYVSNNAYGNWEFIGKGTGNTIFDFEDKNISDFRYVKIEDYGNGTSVLPRSGFDLDAVEIISYSLSKAQNITPFFEKTSIDSNPIQFDTKLRYCYYNNF